MPGSRPRSWRHCEARQLPEALQGDGPVSLALQLPPVKPGLPPGGAVKAPCIDPPREITSPPLPTARLGRLADRAVQLGAKIGVIGLNGAGKSSLLRIMAGEDSDIIGEARPASGIRVGYLAQEPSIFRKLTDRCDRAIGSQETISGPNFPERR